MSVVAIVRAARTTIQVGNLKLTLGGHYFAEGTTEGLLCADHGGH